MQFNVNIKPVKITKPTKSECYSTLHHRTFGYLHFGNNKWVNWGFFSDGYVYAYTCQKYRRKKKDGVNIPGRWEMYAYKIPVDLLKRLGKKVVQGNRTFKLVPLEG